MDIEHLEEVGHIDCLSCGAEMTLKVNINGGVCGVCTNVVRPDIQSRQKYCWHRVTFSTYASQEIIKDYLEGKQANVAKEDQDQQTEEYTPTKERGDGEAVAGGGDGGEEPAAAPQRGEPDNAGGIAAGLKHFLTGE